MAKRLGEFVRSVVTEDLGNGNIIDAVEIGDGLTLGINAECVCVFRRDAEGELRPLDIKRNAIDLDDAETAGFMDEDDGERKRRKSGLICASCGGFFVPATSRQRVCSAECL